MAVFLLIIGGCLLALLAWVLYSRRGPRPEKRARAEDKVYALNTQIRSVEPPEHTTGVAFGVLLKAARATAPRWRSGSWRNNTAAACRSAVKRRSSCWRGGCC